MRRLYNTVADWLFYHSPARIPVLLSRMEHLEARMRDARHLEARMGAMEAVLDRIGPVSTEEREIRQLVRKAYATPEGREALDWMFGLSAENLALAFRRATAKGDL